MTSAQQRRVRDLFELALDREDAPDLTDWVAREAADDAAVRDEVLSLLSHHSQAGEFLAQPIAVHVPDLFAADESLAAGTAIGEYRIVRELGRGGMGRVYLATDTRLGRTVALKALAPHLLRDPAHRTRLRREARAAATLSHPGICTVFALEEVDGELYIISEFVDGETLGDVIRAGRRPSPDDVMRTARELAAALASAHAKGVVHRDLKPDNVMRAHDGRLKILDFGLARVDRPEGALVGNAPSVPGPPWLTGEGVIVGTPAYMAPEQINGEVVDAHADVFAFGVLVYEFSTGTHPFQGATLLATMARILESDAKPMTGGLPRGVSGTIARCLRKNPLERFGSAAEIVAALDAAGESAHIVRPTATWWRTHQLVVILLYIVASALGWQIKTWVENPINISIFLALGAAATVNGVLRGHLLFTEIVNSTRLFAERKRTGLVILIFDLLMSALLLADAVRMAPFRALPALFTLALALALGLAVTVLEPATTEATFGMET